MKPIEIIIGRLRAATGKSMGFWVVLSVAALAGALVAVLLTLVGRHLALSDSTLRVPSEVDDDS